MVAGPSSGNVRGPELRTIGRLASLVGDVVNQLDGKSDVQLLGAVAECNAALEVCLELQRDLVEQDDLIANAKDDLRRLARLLTMVERADIPFVLRQIRRVLGRFDALAP